MVAEVSNTPWNEMHCYVLDPRSKGVKARVRCVFDLTGVDWRWSGGRLVGLSVSVPSILFPSLLFRPAPLRIDGRPRAHPFNPTLIHPNFTRVCRP